MNRRENPNHWARKHMGEIAWLATHFAENANLHDSQREAFDNVHALARPLATCRLECHRENVGMAVVALCAACLISRAGGECGGRCDWRDHCALLSSQLAA